MEKTKILIVEDEAIIAMEIENQLHGLGYEVTSTVDTGEKAIQKAEADKPDLILMDIRIKGEMDGIDAAEVIRNRFGIPVIFSTAYLDEERIERAKITMPFGYVLKPIQERDLKVTVEMALYVSKVDVKRKELEEERDRILNLSSDLICIAGTDGYFKYLNPAWERMMGYTIREMLSRPFFDFMHPEDQKISEKEIDSLTDGNETIGFENRYICKDNSVQTISWRATYLPEMHAMYCIGRNVTDRKQAEESMLQSQALLQKAEEVARIGTWKLDHPARKLQCSDELYRILGLPRIEGKDLLLDDAIMAIHPDDREKAIHASETAIEDKKSFQIEYRIVHLDGTEYDVLHKGEIVCDNMGEIVEIIGVVQDITDQKMFQLKMLEKDRLYRKIFETCPDGIAIGDLDGTIYDANPAFLKQLGYSSLEKLKNKNFREFTPKKWHELEEAHLKQALKNGTSKFFEKEYIKKDGTVYPVAVSGWAIMDDSGNPIKIGAFARDLSKVDDNE
jgi:PAS domain S-box-containing protein